MARALDGEVNEMIRTSMTAGAVALGAAYTTLQVLGRRAGSTPAERAARLPGDELVQHPHVGHAVHLDR